MTDEVSHSPPDSKPKGENSFDTGRNSWVKCGVEFHLTSVKFRQMNSFKRLQHTLGTSKGRERSWLEIIKDSFLRCCRHEHTHKESSIHTEFHAHTHASHTQRVVHTHSSTNKHTYTHARASGQACAHTPLSLCLFLSNR